ncbi:MAG: shikimate kinase [Pirellulaceae bacterium]|nr:shikimate kinase [Pirellulaceae bacterium]
MERAIFLVGYRGSGKSSIGQRLAELLGRPLIDSDDCIETASHKSIREIFADSGEEAFRALETKAIKNIVERKDAVVVSLGGGAVLRKQNRDLIAKHGVAVWLQVSAKQAANRIQADHSTAKRRPALTQLAGYDEIVRLLEIREPIYRDVADFIIQTDGRTIEELAQQIADWYTESLRSQGTAIEQ